MKSRKLILPVISVLVIMVLIVSCSSGELGSESGKPHISVISKGVQHQFWQAVKVGSEKAAADYDVEITFEGPETEVMVDKQVEMFRAALDKNPAAICLAAIDSKALDPLLQRAQQEGIPVIGFDSGVASDSFISMAATDNVASAALAADKMAELIGAEGDVAVIAYDQTNRSGIDRVDGFVGRMESKYPNITVVDVQYDGGDQSKSTDLARAIIQSQPNLKGVFGTNEGSIIGILNAISELNIEGKLIVIGYDSGQRQMDAIRLGIQAGAITQNPIGIGYKCVEAAIRASDGERLPKNIDTGYLWYDAINIDDEEIQVLLYK
jgi:ribose transport system substrate-binding protein